MLFKNTNPKNGPVGEWEAETKRSVGFMFDFEDWIKHKWENSNKMSERYFFVTSWRNAFIDALEECS